MTGPPLEPPDLDAIRERFSDRWHPIAPADVSALLVHIAAQERRADLYLVQERAYIGRIKAQDARIAELEQERANQRKRGRPVVELFAERDSESDRLRELLREAHDWLRGPLSPGAFAVDLYGRIAVALAEPPK